ncbi:Tripartite motif-containing protein 3, partial [Trichinella spiralis]
LFAVNVLNETESCLNYFRNMNEMNLTNLSFTDSGCESDVDEEEYMCYVGNIVEVPLELNDRLRSLPHAELIEHLTAELRHDIVSQVRKLGKIRIRSKTGQFAVRFKPTVVGTYHMEVRFQEQQIDINPIMIRALYLPTDYQQVILGENIFGTYFRSFVNRLRFGGLRVPPLNYRSVFQFGSRGTGPGQMEQPKDIQVTADGSFVVSDVSNQTIQMFDRNFRFVEQWKNTDHFPRPLGIWQLENSFGDSSCQGDRYFLITAKQCSQVNLVNVSTGELVAEYGRDFLHSPHGLLVDRNNRLVVVDTGRQKIFWYDLERCVKIGQSGMVLKPACKLKNPLFVAMDSRNRLHVSNCSESRICMFDLNRFNFVGKYGDEVLDRAPPAPSIYSSVGIAVDLADRSYVVDWMQHRIVIFGPQGEPLGMVDPFVSKLRSPQGIAAFGDGLVAVADAGSHCVKIYSCNDDDEQ